MQQKMVSSSFDLAGYKTPSILASSEALPRALVASWAISGQTYRACLGATYSHEGGGVVNPAIF